MNEQLIKDCLRMFKQRRDYAIKNATDSENKTTTGMYLSSYEAFAVVCNMLECAINNDAKELSLYDCYNEDD